MHKSWLVGFSVSALAMAVNVNAMEFGSPIKARIDVPTPAVHGLAASVATKDVYVMSVKLSSAEKKQFFTPRASQSNLMMASASGLPASVNRGMNNTPVLDQGQHGTCVTFANTAAIDALIGKGDYVSQLCSLELGGYLKPRSYQETGWDGATGNMVLNQLMTFGVVSKANEKSKSCAGLTSYPGSDANNTGTAMSLDDYKLLSEDISQKYYWKQYVSMVDRSQWADASVASQSTQMLTQVKTLLSTSDAAANKVKVTFATLLPTSHCQVGACGKYHANYDTWAYSNAIKNDTNPDPSTIGGHEMVIIGYDDNAVATDNEGAKHKGLLILRNSWGPSAGDKGNYYMTYEFFKQYAMELQTVSVMPQDSN